MRACRWLGGVGAPRPAPGRRRSPRQVGLAVPLRGLGLLVELVERRAGALLVVPGEDGVGVVLDGVDGLVDVGVRDGEDRLEVVDVGAADDALRWMTWWDAPVRVAGVRMVRRGRGRGRAVRPGSTKVATNRSATAGSVRSWQSAVEAVADDRADDPLGGFAAAWGVEEALELGRAELGAQREQGLEPVEADEGQHGAGLVRDEVLQGVVGADGGHAGHQRHGRASPQRGDRAPRRPTGRRGSARSSRSPVAWITDCLPPGKAR